MHSKDSKFVIVLITYFLKMRMVKKLVVSISPFKFAALRKFQTSSASSIAESAKCLQQELAESLQTVKKSHQRSCDSVSVQIYPLPPFLDVKKFSKSTTRFSQTFVFNSDTMPLPCYATAPCCLPITRENIQLVFTNGIFS